MKKRYILGSVIVALLMLVSTQIVFLNNVKSDPTAHDGDAVAGTFWLSELDVSGDLQTIDYIGVPHVNATDDWVVWTTGEGDVIANWSVDIDNNHPEYWVIFSIGVFNADDNNNVIGYDNFSKTYDADTSYDESGSLSCDIDLISAVQAGEQTLVCHLGALVKINDTSEAKNFTIWAEDRSVIGVDFEWPRGGSFEPFLDESNDEFMPVFSYISGWNTSGRFSTEDEMFNGQTVFITGHDSTKNKDINHWYIGQLNLTEDSSDWWDLDDSTFWVGDEVRIWGRDDNHVYGWTYLDWEVDEGPKDVPMNIYYWLVIEDPPDEEGLAVFPVHTRWVPEQDLPSGRLKGFLSTTVSHDDPNGNADGNISIEGYVYAWTIFLFRDICFDLSIEGDYRINYTDDPPPNAQFVSQYDWQGKLAFNLGSFSAQLSGTSEISADISEGLTKDYEFLYIYAGDTGDTTVSLTC